MEEETRSLLLPAIQEKVQEVAKFIEEKLKKGQKGLSAVQIIPLISKRSLSDIATIGTKTYTPEELGIALNIYIDMIAKINEYAIFPPSKQSFCLLLGISTQCYNNWLQSPEKADIMNVIETYITGTVLTSAQIGELKEITSMFSLKSQHGFVEAQAPVVITHKKGESIENIQEQLKTLKSGKVTEAEFEEK